MKRGGLVLFLEMKALISSQTLTDCNNVRTPIAKRTVRFVQKFHKGIRLNKFSIYIEPCKVVALQTTR